MFDVKEEVLRTAEFILCQVLNLLTTNEQDFVAIFHNASSSQSHGSLQQPP
jgi:hypothetical protein